VSPDWMFTRLVVVLLAIVGPIYFFLLMLLLPFEMTPFANDYYNFLFQYIATPAIFSLTWVGLIYYSRYRLSNSVHNMGETTTAVPLRWRVFYGMNAAFVVGFFVLPMIISPLAIISGLWVAGHVFYTIGVGKMGGGRAASALGIIMAIALCVLPAIVAIYFIPGYLQVWDSILAAWSSFWFRVVAGFAQCLVNALSFGAPVYFLYFGAQEYDRGVYGTVYTKTPTRSIRLGELIIFIIFLYLYLPPVPTPWGTPIPFADMSWLFTSYINTISLAIVVLLFIIRRLLKVKSDTTIGGPVNLIIICMFLVVDIFFKLDVVIVTITIWLAFLLFASIFAANYIRASSRELY
jgi:hypothetical protein